MTVHDVARGQGAARNGHTHEDIPEPPTDAEAGDSGAEPSTWRQVNLEAVLAGDWKPAQPTVGRRTDGVGLFYPGKVHTIASESEAGKTWLALAAAFEELRAGNTVLYIDFEDDEGGVVGRLLTLQTPPEWVRDRFLYLRPTEPLGIGENLAALGELVTTHKPTLAVIDGVTEAMTMHSLDPLNNRDIATFGRILPRRLANTGCATTCLDHVVKDADNRGRYAIGGVHKLNGLDGAAYLLRAADPFGVGLTGRSTILISKDRPGQLRKHANRSGDGLHHFGDITVTSHDDTYAEFEIRPPTAAHTNEFRPTTLMGRICAALNEHGDMSQRALLATVKGRKEYARDALALLQRDGYVTDKTPLQLIKPWDGDQNTDR